jgi:galactose mutarotase-like enzyme
MYTLKNEVLEVLINPMGAELQSLSHPSKGNVMWRKNDLDWNRVSPILFPIVGRLLNDQYTYQDKKYAMRQHGFARDQWFDVHAHQKTSVTFCLKANDATRAHYPFEFELRVTYALMGSLLTISHEVMNTDLKDLLFSIGGHPGFHIDGKLEDYVLDFGGEFTVQQHIISGNYYNGETKDLPLHRTFNLSDSLFASNAIVIKSPPFESIGFGKKEGPKLLTLHCKDWSAVGLWTKPGAPFFCIEPWWGWADTWDAEGVLSQKQGILSLLPGEIRRHRYSIEIH